MEQPDDDQQRREAMTEESNGTCCPKSKCRAKHLQVFVGSTWGFLTNVERAIIMPSLWLYLKTTWDLTAATQFYAATVAAFSLAILIFTPLFGYAAYKGVRTQVLLLISNQLEILGNIMYLIGKSPWVILAGRFISGIGACCDPPLYTDMIRLTTKKERTSYVIGLLLPRQVGLLFGPAFTLLLHELNLNVGTFNINVYNVPGLLMASLWGLHCIVVLFAYPNMDALTDPLVDPITEGVSDKPLALSTRVRRYFIADRSELDKDPDQSIEEYVDEGTGGSSCCLRNPKLRRFVLYTRLPLVTLFGIVFMIYFSILCLESVLPPVAERLYGWSEVQISEVYLVSGFLVIGVFIIQQLMTRCVKDVSTLTVGMICLLFAYMWMACYLAYTPTPPKTIGIPVLLTGVVLHVIGSPLVSASCESLYTKLTPNSQTEFAQTVFRTVLNVGFFAGPFIGGSLVQYSYAAFLIMLLLVFIPLVLLCLCYEAFSEPQEPIC